jgi:hypothetical protein
MLLQLEPGFASPGTLVTLLKTCDFFAVESGIRYAVHYLENHVNLGSA